MNIREQFEKFNEENPKVWEYFERFTLQAIHKGKNKISHWLIVNRIRWEIYIETTGDDFKINNNFIALYARLFVEKYPQHKTIFSLRKMKDE
jgi:hypothetical protein